MTEASRTISTQDKALAQTAPEAAMQVVADALARLKYGVVQLTVHEGRLVQVDVTERSRFVA